jgi:hypothetical protein
MRAVLVEVRDLLVGEAAHTAGIRDEVSHGHPEERRLAAPVRADDGHALGPDDAQRHAVEHRPRGAGQARR